MQARSAQEGRRC